ncbi:MAG: flagellar basal-body MS-ring/collar protein FliF [Thermodesulfobacteriota bacterium]
MATPKEIFEQFLSIVKGLTVVQRAIGAGIVLLVLGGLLLLIFSGGGAKEEYKVLFSGLTQEDAAEVVNKLKEQRSPYQLSENGTAILVPAAQVYETRLALAGEGLPRGGGVGFEIFNQTSLGQTDFVQRLNYQRALQGELARTIRSFQQVLEARVHLATPKESVFIEDEKPPTASISVKLRGREKLSQQQIQSIVNLVASAVPGLTTENITLVDTSGRLLFRKQAEGEGVLTGTQLEYQMKIEDTLRQKVETMLEEVVGTNRARARVTAEIDFAKVERTEESFDPEAQVVRSEQLLSENDQRPGAKPQGIPGVKGELATFAEAGEESATGSGYTRNNVTRNYEISKQVKHVQEKGGTVKRLSVAVMVDGTYEKAADKDGATSLKYQPRTPEEMRNLDKLVKNAIGFSEERGDQVEVASMPFALSSAQEPEQSALDKWRSMSEGFMMPLVILLAVVLVIFFVVKPFLRILAAKQIEAHQVASMAEHAAGHGPRLMGEEGVEDEDLALAPRGLTDQERIYRLAQSDPDRAADLVRRWLREEA